VDATCRQGFNVYEALSHDHRAQGLQFVPGLGPRKAAALLRELQNRLNRDRAVRNP